MHSLHRATEEYSNKTDEKTEKITWREFHLHSLDSNFAHLKDHFLSQAAEEVQECIHQNINIYLCFPQHVNLFNIKTFIYLLVFVSFHHSRLRLYLGVYGLYS